MARHPLLVALAVLHFGPWPVAPLSAQVESPVLDRAVYAERIPLLLIGGANNHDWEWTHRSLQQILEETGRFTVTITTTPAETLADPDALAGHRAFVLDYNGPRWGETAEANFIAAVRGGTGVVVIHAANNAFPGWAEYEDLVCLLWRDGTGHGQFHPFDVKVVDAEHPITRGMPGMRMHPDELYHRLVNTQQAEYRLLATALSTEESGGTGVDEPMVLVRSYGSGRVFHTPLGHVWRDVPASRASHADPQFRRLVARGAEWAATGTVTLSPIPPNWLSAEEREAGFELLFDGRDTDGWRRYRGDGFPPSGWSVAGAALHHAPDGGGGDIVTVDSYGDFELRFEWAVAAGANSGVIYRAGETESDSYMTGPEFQILDDEGHQAPADGATSAGSLYGLAAPQQKLLRPAGEYNTGRIVVRGWRVEHWVNETKVVDVDLGSAELRERIAGSKFGEWPFATLAEGRIALQDHGGEVWYRSLRIRRLGDDD